MPFLPGSYPEVNITRAKLTAEKLSAIRRTGGGIGVAETEMNSEDRKAAITAYKERKNVAGIYAVRCAASGQVWVGQTPNLDTIQNRIWFALRLGSNSNRDLQRAWSAHGGDNFAFESLERLKDEESPYVRDALLKERALHWRSMLNASII
jgi:hypothetical protein